MLSGEASQLDLGGSLYVGSFDYMDPHLRPPATVWSGVLRHGYVGCLRELMLNGASIDLVQHAHQQDVGRFINSVSYISNICSSLIHF